MAPWQISRAACTLSLLVALGCAETPPQFPLNMEGRRPESVQPQRAEAIVQALAKLFGTPDEPKVPEGVALDRGLLALAGGPIRGGPRGQQQGLYRRHCAACHGLAGDGAGPAARLNPYPRDFRTGVFKYTSTRAGAKPTPEDLQRTLRRGVPATAMPSFARLTDVQVAALIEYVKYLSIRGQAELFLFQLVVDDQCALPPSLSLVMEEGVLPAADSWEDPVRHRAELVVDPPPRPPLDTPERLAASINLGRTLYLSTNCQCVKCHGPEGKGDGEQSELYDNWNKPKGLTPEQRAALEPLFTLPIQRLRPRNFHQGIFRGGSRPLDLYWRVCVGIKGTPMPPAGRGPGAPGVLTDQEIWHVVHFVLAQSRSLAAAMPHPTPRDG